MASIVSCSSFFARQQNLKLVRCNNPCLPDGDVWSKESGYVSERSRNHHYRRLVHRILDGLRSCKCRRRFAVATSHQLAGLFRSLSGPSDALPLPESPRWLIEMNRKSEASEVIARPMGGDATVDHPEAIPQCRQIESSLEIESAGGPFRYSELFEGGKLPISDVSVFVVLFKLCSSSQVRIGRALSSYSGVYQEELLLRHPLSKHISK
jgi:hypothetical protein